MSATTQIEWTDATWNPVTGCFEDQAWLQLLLRGADGGAASGAPGQPFENGFDLRLRPERLTQPLDWRRPRRVFVNSMSDLFHKEVPKPFIDSCLRHDGGRRLACVSRC